MAEKDAVRYNTYTNVYIKPPNPNNAVNTMPRTELTSSLKSGSQTTTTASTSTIKLKHSSKRNCCNCTKSSSFWTSLLTNLGICTLLFAYTLLGE
jgi:hypothetical protein